MNLEKRGIWIASFDIGKKNFCWCVEECDEKLLSTIRNVDKDKRFNKNGTETEEMKYALEQVYKNGKIIHHQNTDLTKNCKSNKSLDIQIFVNMYNLLDEHFDLWSKCDFIVIEEQMHFGVKTNFMAVKLAQHCFSYFVFKFDSDKPIIDFPSYHKTQLLGALKIESKPYKNGEIRYKGMEKSARKKWAVEKAFQILKFRNETSVFETVSKDSSLKNSSLKKKKPKKIKKDDLADTFLMIQAFKYLKYVDKSCLI